MTGKPAPKKKLGVKIEKPKPKNTIGGRPAGKRVDTGGARNVGIVDKSKPPPKKTPPPDKKTLQTVLPIMASVGKEKGKKINLTKEMVNELPDRILRRLLVRVTTSEKWTGSAFDRDILYAPQKASAKRMKEFLTDGILKRYINPIVRDDLNPDIPPDRDWETLSQSIFHLS